MKNRINVYAVLVIIAAGMLAVSAAGVAQQAGSSGEKDTPKKIGSAIDGYRWEFPCKFAMPENPKPGMDCESGLVKGDPKKTDNGNNERVPKKAYAVLKTLWAEKV